MAYLTLLEFTNLSIVPSAVIDRVEASDPGWIAAQLEEESAWIDARLAKRYAAPFASPYPRVVRLWLTKMVSAAVYDKHGVQPLDEQAQRYYAAADTARAEIREAADAEQGLFELPLRADTTEGGITRGRTLSYSEASPYVWRDRQARRGRCEDRRGRGSGG
jgi:phage gp36-like protein